MKELLSLQDHARRLFLCLHDLGSPYEFQIVYDWLDVASRIESVDYDAFKYDYSIGLCESADDYSDALGKHNKQLLPELVFFNFVWCSLESLIITLKLKKCPQGFGKISKATYFIKTEFENSNVRLKYYNELIHQLRSFLKSNNIIHDERKPLDSLFQIKECNSEHGIGLSVVYEIRNEFAHGSFLFPEPPDWGIEKKALEVDIFSVASRIVLLSIQMILIAKYKNDVSEIQVETIGIGDEIYVKTLDYLRLLHYYDFESTDDEQLELEFS